MTERGRSAAFCALVFAFRYPLMLARVRARGWGAPPRSRTPALVVVNHQHEDEVELLLGELMIAGRFRTSIYTSASRRLFECGYLAAHVPPLRRIARRFDPSAVFAALGVLPVENELATRPLRSVALAVREGAPDLPLRDVFARLPSAAAGLATLDAVLAAPPDRTAGPTRLSALREPHRSAVLKRTRAQLASDLARIERRLRDGAIFLTTGEGRYSTDGCVRPLRGIVARLAPVAAPTLAAVAFDPLRGRRLGMLYRFVAPAHAGALERSLAAARPITVSAVLAAWLHRRRAAVAPFAPEEACWAVARTLRRLPRGAFVDPELLAEPYRAAGEALRAMRRRGWLARARGGTLALAGPVRDRRFPLVADMIAYLARQYDETVDACAWLASAA